jgi:hypothetical protein
MKSMSNTESTTYPTEISPFRKVCAGVYTADIAVPDQMATTRQVTVELGVVGENCESGDGGWWALHTPDDSTGWFYPTKKAAIAAAHRLVYSPKWGFTGA